MATDVVNGFPIDQGAQFLTYEFTVEPSLIEFNVWNWSATSSLDLDKGGYGRELCPGPPVLVAVVRNRAAILSQWEGAVEFHLGLVGRYDMDPVGLSRSCSRDKGNLRLPV